MNGTLSELIEHGVAFFTGKTVTKEAYDAALKAKDVEIEAIKATAKDPDQALVAKVDELAKALKAKDDTIKALEASIQTAEAKAAQLLSRVGVDANAIPSQDKDKTTETKDSAMTTESTFPKLVNEKMERNKMSKGQAVKAAIRENPKAYEAWRKDGDTSKL